ncbi:DNA-binding protein [Pseudodesulfovibrio methanolicus]|uniref:DNA-binding protein n=1 Tax=Pseudodesulfovibrio methanolicus TaxID=3126690 RepID=A0ABZ2J494_9BACT
MTTRHLKEFADLYGKGFRPYHGEILPGVYEELGCKDPKKAYWVCKWPILYCFGCGERCTPKSPHGFQVMLPENPTSNAKFSISPAEMLASKPFLRADEAAYCLCISPSQVYAITAEGKLIRHLDTPFRVTSESVKEEMNRIDL